MNQRTLQIFAVYGSGVLIGVALILFPSAGPLFTDPAFHNLREAQFGILFTPQIITAIAASSLTATLSRRWGMKRVLRTGLLAAAVSMLLLTSTHLVIGSPAAFVLLLTATGAIGAGFGFTISALNAYAFDLFPDREDSAVTAVHVATGTGQVGAALLLNLFLGLNAWWGAPILIAIVVGLMVTLQWGLPLQLRSEGEPQVVETATTSAARRLPRRVWFYAVVTFTYGAIEGTFGNWTPIYLEQGAGLTAANAALGLSIFWGAVTAGRVLFALLAVRINVRPLFMVTPLVAGAVFLLWPGLDGTAANFAAVIIAGLAISFFFPYAVSLASNDFPVLTAAVSGTLVAGLQLGNGLSANIVGVASQLVPLSGIIRLSALYAVLMAVVVLYLERSGKQAELNQELPCVVLPCVQTEKKQ
jgi:fucose permease